MPWSGSGRQRSAFARRDSTARDVGSHPTNDGWRQRASSPVGISSDDRIQGDRNACNPSVSALNGISAAPSEKLVAFAVAPGECISA